MLTITWTSLRLDNASTEIILLPESIVFTVVAVVDVVIVVAVDVVVVVVRGVFVVSSVVGSWIAKVK